VTSDYALAADEQGKIIVHRADCPDVRAQAAAGDPVATFLGCERPLPDDLTRHDCLERD
jgi:hypothetical protein